jgi:chromosomal replication initiation ATPase DnaA
MLQRDKYTIPYFTMERFKGMRDEDVINHIEMEVCTFYDIPHHMLFEKTKDPHYTFPANLCMTLVVNYTRHSMKWIASHYNRKNHSTAICAVRLIKGQLESKILTEDKKELLYFMQLFSYAVPEAANQLKTA